MKTLTRNVGKRPRSGDVLPTPLKTLRDLGVEIRQSEMMLIAGQPGVGKSSIALALAVYAKVPTLYVCADTSELTMRVRTAAMLSGNPQHECEQRMYTDVEWAQQIFDQTKHISWSFDPTPSIATIEEEIKAYEEVYGTTPELIVVDNLMDVTADTDNEWGGMRTTMKQLKTMCRTTEAAIMILHHTSEAVQKVGLAPPRSAIQGKVSHLPAVILTIDSSSDSDTMSVAVVKNRFGRADATGTYGGYLNFTPSTMQITDQTITTVGPSATISNWF